MKSIYIIRHAKSSWEDPEIPDVVRPLNNRGKRASNAIGKYLAKLHEKPDLIISSPATRAYHTAVNVARILGHRLKSIQVEPAVYYEGEQGVLNMLRRQENKYDSIFVFGHEPTCSDLVETFTGESLLKFPTASVYKIDLDIDDWGNIYKAAGKKVFYIFPKAIDKGL